jgi:photosystem II stability/assembly factor-like uncharacterized protein
LSTSRKTRLIASGPKPMARYPALRRMVCFWTSMLLLATASCAPFFRQGLPTEITPTGQTTPTAVPIDAPEVSNPALVSIRMFDELNGWGITDTQVVRTVDGGLTWHAVGPQVQAALGYGVTSFFMNASQAWILIPNEADMLTGILYRTSDGGAHWNESPTQFGGGQLQMLDARQGWMMSSLGAGAGSMGVAIFQTTDSGASWAQTYSNDPSSPTASDSLPLVGLKDGIAATSIRSAWLGGVIYTPGQLYLYKTGDGGRTWQEVKIPPPPGYEQAEIETTGPVFLTASNAVLPVHLSSQNGVLLAFYTSADGGNTWTLSPNFVSRGGTVDFVSPTVGFTWNGTNFYMTTDAAKDWTAIAPDVAFGDGFGGMDFVSPTAGFVLAGDSPESQRVYKTLDGAATWQVVGP